MDSLALLDNQSRRKFKKVFEQLDEGYVIRTPVFDDAKIADVIIEGPRKSWLMVGCHQDVPSPNELTKYVAFCAATCAGIKYLAVTASEESLFDGFGDQIPGVIRLDQRTFFAEGAATICREMEPVHDDVYRKIKARLVPESHVVASGSREAKVRDNEEVLRDYFLDYDQELAVKLDLLDNNPAEVDENISGDFSLRLVNGVAGSGKTLILINRAILYGRKYPDKQAILLIHNNPITQDVTSRIEQKMGEIPANLKIRTFHAFALSQQRKVFGNTEPIFDEKKLKELKGKIWSMTNGMKMYPELGGFSQDQIWHEIEYINDALIENKSAYLEIERHGRGFSLNKSQRESLWQLYEIAVAQSSSLEKGFLPSLYIRNLCLADGIDQKLAKYDHIMIDEAQFFCPSWFQLTKRSLKSNGMLFMCADARQGFLRHRISWHSVGLSVRGRRTKKLKHSYRTTYEIMLAASALVEGIDENPDDFIKPDMEKMRRGRKPVVIYRENPQDELKIFIEKLAQVVKSRMTPLHQIMILRGDGVNPDRLLKAIEKELGTGTVFNCNRRGYWMVDRIKLLTINSCTGMEAAVVFVVGAGSLLARVENIELSGDERSRLQDELARKLYVAMTRASQKLLLFSTEKLPGHVEQFFELA